MLVLPGVRTVAAGMKSRLVPRIFATSVLPYRSYLYRDWMMRRAIVSAFIGLIMLAAGIGVTVSILRQPSCTTPCLVASRT